MIYMHLFVLAVGLASLAFWMGAFERRTHENLYSLLLRCRDMAGDLVALSSRVASLEEHARVGKSVARLEVKAILDQALDEHRRADEDLKFGLEGLAHQVETLAEHVRDDVRLLRRDLDAVYVDRTDVP